MTMIHSLFDQQMSFLVIKKHSFRQVTLTYLIIWVIYGDYNWE